MAFINIGKKNEPPMQQGPASQPQQQVGGGIPGTGILGLKHSKPDPAITALTENISAVSRQLRMLEERYITLRKKIQVSDQSIIEDTNKIFTQLKLIVGDINDLKVQVEDMRQKLEMFSNEIGEMASRQDLKIVQRYVDLWEPMQFLTEKEAIEIIRQAIEAKQQKSLKK